MIDVAHTVAIFAKVSIICENAANKPQILRLITRIYKVTPADEGLLLSSAGIHFVV